MTTQMTVAPSMDAPGAATIPSVVTPTAATMLPAVSEVTSAVSQIKKVARGLGGRKKVLPVSAHFPGRALFVNALCLAMLGVVMPTLAADIHQVSELPQEVAPGSSASRAVIEQYGVGNDGAVVQSGSLHDSYTFQAGTRNSALTTQAGQGHDARILQSGGYLQGTILQYGYGHEATLVQQGYGKEANIIQGGIRGQVDVMQLNGSRGTPVEVRQFSRGQAAIQVIQH